MQAVLAITLDRALTDAEALPADEREMIENLLRQRRAEAWRRETATDAKRAAREFQTGKLESQPATDVIAQLRAGLNAKTR
jgi:hypothetical protein